jgi:hypothetical protein
MLDQDPYKTNPDPQPCCKLAEKVTQIWFIYEIRKPAGYRMKK